MVALPAGIGYLLQYSTVAAASNACGILFCRRQLSWTKRSKTNVNRVQGKEMVEVQQDRFVPTCSICGEKHWPHHPSAPCFNKNKMKAKAKAEKKAKALAKIEAKAQAKARKKAETKAMVEAKAKTQADARKTAYAETIARAEERLRAERGEH